MPIVWLTMWEFVHSVIDLFCVLLLLLLLFEQHLCDLYLEWFVLFDCWWTYRWMFEFGVNCKFDFGLLWSIILGIGLGCEGMLGGWYLLWNDLGCVRVGVCVCVCFVSLRLCVILGTDNCGNRLGVPGEPAVPWNTKRFINGESKNPVRQAKSGNLATHF